MTVRKDVPVKKENTQDPVAETPEQQGLEPKVSSWLAQHKGPVQMAFLGVFVAASALHIYCYFNARWLVGFQVGTVLSYLAICLIIAGSVETRCRGNAKGTSAFALTCWAVGGMGVPKKI